MLPFPALNAHPGHHSHRRAIFRERKGNKRGQMKTTSRVRKLARAGVNVGAHPNAAYSICRYSPHPLHDLPR